VYRLLEIIQCYLGLSTCLSYAHCIMIVLCFSDQLGDRL